MKKSNVTTEYLNFKLIKEQTDVQKLLSFLGFGDTYKLNTETDELVGVCPLQCSHQKKNFSFNIKKKTYQCFSCKARGSVIDFIKNMRNVDGADMDLRKAGDILNAINKKLLGEDQYNKELVQLYKAKVAIKSPESKKYAVPQKQPAMVADSTLAQSETNEDLDQKLIEAGRVALNRKLVRMQENATVTDTDGAIEIAELKTGSLTHETMGMLLLNAKHGFIDYVDIAKGSPHSIAQISINYLMRTVIERGASAIILCHNHPSGNSDPSQQDIAFTKRTCDALALIDVSLLDHIVVGSQSISMRQEGLI